LRVAAQHDVPVVFTHHTLYEQYTHYLPVDSAAVQAFVVELATRFANCCDGVIAPSASLARLLEQRGVTSQIRVIPTGIDTRVLAAAEREPWRRRFNLRDDAVLIGHVGRLALEKNLSFLAEALARCLAREPRAHAFIVGEGPAQAEIEEVFTTRRVRDRVFFAGKLTGRAWREAYAAMDLFAFSSRSETQGMVLTEAMAAGVPVIALDASGVRDVVRDRRNGRLLPGDAAPEAMARALTAAVRHPERREPWRQEARRTAAAFDRRVTAAQALDFYRDLITARGQRVHLEEWERWWHQVRDRIAIEGRLIGAKLAAATHALGRDTPDHPALSVAG
jgi:glycosyltransferase involved in cell wall biosynthesis